jgi:hypothetical protein
MGPWGPILFKERERKVAKIKKRDGLNLGKISLDLGLKTAGEINTITHTVAEQGKEQLKEYIPNLIEAVNKGKILRPDQDFYIIVLTKRERLMQNVMRHFFFTRTSCPTPDFDQAVYFYSHLKEEVEFVWVLPDRDTAFYFFHNPLSIPPEDKCLLDIVVDYFDGTLDREAKKRNGETKDQLNPIVNVK